ncbi:ABC transporter ATP-binding protein [filamentous cyanobacterium CCT1]|nr:ABC transporter ATP-binding protein [filamentous cyanobacterium CCT1]PSN80766.1 ABC transporter ATP-binding protein [filamentous cyanobacterium CCP4]
MSDPVIQVENLGKKYVLGQQQQGSSRYVALRDVLSDRAKVLGRRLRHPLKPQANSRQDEFWALKDVSFEVKQGEVVGIIGRNGAGKSTLLKVLSRITEPTTGRVRLRGRVASLLEVGTGFHPELTGRENIFLNGAILGMSRAEINRKFDEIVDFAEVERFLDTPVKRYSSGMYVRLAFAVAAHLEPEILVVDEVLAVGDAAFQKKCLGKMGDVAANNGKTILFVSHNMAAVNRLCTVGIWIEKGNVKQIGSTEKIVSTYLNSNADLEGEHRWRNFDKAPGNSKIKLLAIRVLNQNQEICSTIDSQEPFSVEIEYQILKELKGARIGFFFNNSEGVVIFAPNDNENAASGNNPRKPGKYISRCQIQGKLFNHGTYYISASADIPLVGSLFFVEDVLSIRIERTKGDYISRPDTLPGLICPTLFWNIRSV